MVQHSKCLILVAFFRVLSTTSFLLPERTITNQKFRSFEPQLPNLSSRGPIAALNAGGGKDLSSSSRERREEENRRKKRKDDVVIGKTSAKKGEKDYALDPEATEQEFLRQASNIEQKVFLMTSNGKKLLNSLRLEEADKAFDSVLELKPNVYLWQAGIVKFYLGNIGEAGEIFVRNAQRYETKFGLQGSEERIWRHACELKLLYSMSVSERKTLKKNKNIGALIPSIPEFKRDDIFAKETRQVVKITRDLFESSVEGNFPNEILSKAQLLFFARGGTSTHDRKLWKLTAWYYLGLYNDVTGNVDESRKCMKMALKLCPSSGKSDDIVHTLPLLHMSVREWFDDSGFDDDPLEDDPFYRDHSGSVLTTADVASIDRYIEKCIRGGVTKLSMVELRQALRIIGLKTDGSKQDLRERLFLSLKAEAQSFGSGNIP
ncbi:unnamed protein product [Cylindrotheca closterium]|uniref:SAP domain-containing protein n=1 Tax=Cylindrotheca closterium TaxID=2856 RepID=A0AAD2FK43_9STRA|nr:unnamed protein product [Cylindrotheca closterium]